MGQTCGCGEAPDVEGLEVSITSKVDGSHRGLRKPQKQEPTDKEVIKIQAAARGAAERRKLKANGGPKF